MKPRAGRVLLVLSLALNACFAAGFVYTQAALRRMATPEGRIAWAARELGLEPAQHRAIEELNREWRARHRRILEDNAPPLDAFWEELAGPNPETGRLRERLTPLLEAQNAALVESLAYLERTFALLHPEQRAALVRIIRGRRQPWSPPF